MSLESSAVIEAPVTSRPHRDRRLFLANILKRWLKALAENYRGLVPVCIATFYSVEMSRSCADHDGVLTLNAVMSRMIVDSAHVLPAEPSALRMMRGPARI